MLKGAPRHKALLVSSERSHASIVAITHYQGFVIGKKVGYLVLVGLDLVKGIPDVHILGIGAFQLQHRQGQTVDKANNIRAAQLLAALYGELVNGPETVGLEITEVNQKGMVVNDFVIAFVLNRHTLQQQPVEGTVADDGIQAFWLANNCNHLFNRTGGQMRVDTANGRFQIRP